LHQQQYTPPQRCFDGARLRELNAAIRDHLATEGKRGMESQLNGSKELDMLRSIFSKQADLNDYIFRKHAIRDNAGSALTMHAIAAETTADHLSVNDIPNQWLARYSRAMQEELRELDQSLLWKWWSNDKLDVQNVRVELVDILHFLVSAMISAGMTPDSVHSIYSQKHSVNMARQDSGYNLLTKTEDDNRKIR
jgi:hypothetical protein